MVEKKNIPIEPFDGFTVVIPGHNRMQYKTWVPKLQVTIGNYNFVDRFYVVNFSDTNVVLGVQCLYSIGEHIVNYQIPEMKFQDSKGVLKVVRGQHTYPNQVMTCNSMRFILRHEDIEWAIECHITYPKTNINCVGEFVLSPTSYTSKFCSIHPNEVWVKGSFFMVPHEEYKISISPFDDEMIREPYYLHLQ